MLCICLLYNPLVFSLTGLNNLQSILDSHVCALSIYLPPLGLLLLLALMYVLVFLL